MVRIFVEAPFWIVTQVNVVEPLIRGRGVIGISVGAAPASPMKVNSSIGRVPQWGHLISMASSMQIGRSALAFFVNHVSAPEAVEAKGCAKSVGLVLAIVWAKHQPEAGVALKPP